MKYPLIRSAHRGASRECPENTLMAFRRAIEIGVDLIEMDLRLTRDRHVVVMHDETVDRTTNGSGKVWEKNLSEIKQLNAGKGEKVPTLMEVIELVRPHDVRLCLELKYEPETTDRKTAEVEGIATAEAVASIVKREGFVERIILDAFSENVLRYARNLLPATPALHNPWPQDGTLTPRQLVDQVLPVANIQACYYRYCDRTVLDESRLNGLSVFAWDPDDPEEMRRLIHLGVHGIVTNRPDILNQVLEEIHPTR